MMRIKRHATCYTDRTKQNHWCDSCFDLLRDNEPISLDDGSEVKKSDLQEFKNDALPEEGWVNCDDCNSWVHQVCALFNGRANKSNARYTCPNCYLKKGGGLGKLDSGGNKLVKGAEDLVHCEMSRTIESGLMSSLEAAYRQRAAELGVPFDQVEKAERLSVRVISDAEKKHVVGEEVRILRSIFFLWT
jgi:E1A/CREB-binding protein